MTAIKPLSVGALSARFPEKSIPWAASDAIPRGGSILSLHSSQPRAIRALDLALRIQDNGFHVYLSGGENLGRTHLIREFLTPIAKKRPSPPDLLYVHNFKNPDRPSLLAVPAGQGKKIQELLRSALEAMRKNITARLENTAFLKKHKVLQDRFQAERGLLLKRMDQTAGKHGFNLDFDDQGGLTLYPTVDGRRISEEDYDRLGMPLRQGLKEKGESLLRLMSGMVRKLTAAEQLFQDGERKLEKEVVQEAIKSVLLPVQERILKNCRSLEKTELEKVSAYFHNLREDIADHPEPFLPCDPLKTAASDGSGVLHPDIPYEYAINVFVDNSDRKGLPLIIEDHPTLSNLLGCIERESEMGALVTDFTLIRAGALQKANGGFLVLHAEDLLRSGSSWEALLRTLRAGSVKPYDPGDASDGRNCARNITPEALLCNVKVILIGSEDLYESVFIGDSRFARLFKIKAQMTDSISRTPQNIRTWLHCLAGITDSCNLMPFDRSAMVRLAEFSSEMAEDRKKLSLRFPLIRDVMIEAATIASLEGEVKAVSLRHIEETLDNRRYRSNLVEELYMEEYDRDLIKVRTSGSEIGRVNGLSVSWYGDSEFGLPHQISCTVGVGHGGIIDLEREAELGGPIHTKAMLILKSYLTDRFARNKPLVLTGSLCFEQNYAGIEGDSASGAELAALLSAISEVPLKLSLAFTGAVSQSGQIMAVGGVSRKIEGFFNVCSRRGLTGEQGVIMPYDNIDHLMLPQRILEAIEQKRFAVYPVRHITEALELLTGLPAGKPLKSGGFTKNSLFDLVDRRLLDFGYQAENAFTKPPRRSGTRH
ncbi:MAG: AAA family ATPase [Desulfovibrionaceae bacterium]|nr:AAA family ATPase [Desulfovibrionaceae bacterium]